MEIVIQGSLLMVRSMAKEILNGIMEIIMKAILLMMKELVKEPTPNQQEKHILDSL